MKALLTYALNSEGKLVHVDDVPKGKNCGCICPACKEKLQAKKGPQKAHHFAHQPGVDCPNALETTLHLLAKDKIQKAFYEKDVFDIKFLYHSYCKELKSCKFIRYDDCETNELKTFNLKEYYDTCEQEIPYDEIQRRSDLKIWSKANPKMPPIYIEIFVTHPSDTEKLHSGNRIIEIKIDDETDINNVIKNGFEDENLTPYHDKEGTPEPKISFYGFKTEDYANTNINQFIEFSRYILYPSGKYQCYQDCCKCKELKRAPRKEVLYELCFHTFVSFGINELAKWMGYRKYAINNCLLCKNYVDHYYGEGKLCRLYKHLGINRFETFDTSRARTCYYFTLNEEEKNQYLPEHIEDIKTPFTELYNKQL